MACTVVNFTQNAGFRDAKQQPAEGQTGEESEIAKEERKRKEEEEGKDEERKSLGRIRTQIKAQRG